MEPEQRFYLNRNGTKLGPFTVDELKNLWETGALTTEMTILPENGMSQPIAVNAFFASAVTASAIAVGGSNLVFNAAPTNQSSNPEPETAPPVRPLIQRDFQHDPETMKIGHPYHIDYGQIGWMVIGGAVLAALKGLGLIAPYILLVAAGFFTVEFFTKWRIVRIIRDTPTSKTRSAAVGMVEIIGRVISINNICGMYSGLPCVICEYKSEREMDFKAKTVASGIYGAPFLVEDDSGVIMVDPDGADIDFTRPGKDKWDYTSYMYNLRVHEKTVYPGEFIYVLGRADMLYNPEGKAHFMIHKGKYGEPFMIIRGRENITQKRLKDKAWLNFGIGLITLLIGLLFCFIK